MREETKGSVTNSFSIRLEKLNPANQSRATNLICPSFFLTASVYKTLRLS